ncbi:MAG: hypothetical protein ACQKBY_11300, partial [Verrucomicrobiales bacterium]
MKNLLLALCLFPLSFTSAETLEITQAASGKSLEVTPLKVTAEQVTFRAGSQQYTVDLAALTAESRKALQDWQSQQAAKRSEGAEAINQALGHELFGKTDSLFSENPAAVASRLKWRKESETDQSSSFRAYPPL